MNTTEERKNFLNSLGDELTPDLRKQISYLQKRKNTTEVLRPTDSVELRARYIQLRLDEMIASGVSQEGRIEFIRELKRTKILTDDVRAMMALLQRKLSEQE